MTEKAAEKKVKLDALIFVDTNILLDFYRIRGGGSGLELLRLVEAHKAILITGSQVEMEYKKNRQRVILEALNAMKTPDWSGLSAPAFLSDAKPAAIIAKNKKTITAQQEKLKARIAAILDRPYATDPVFQVLQRVFRTASPYNLSRIQDIRFKVRNLARKRFVLGYPPRKGSDTSIGDAINWEWIIHCARESKKAIIIVTRDTDYGVNFGGQFLLNDWLRLEFQERVGKSRAVVITDRLADAFKRVAISVSATAEAEEKRLLLPPPDTIGSFATKINVPAAVLTAFLQQAGVNKSNADELVTNADKMLLLNYLTGSQTPGKA